jgi:hypothetical protein
VVTIALAVGVDLLCQADAYRFAFTASKLYVYTFFASTLAAILWPWPWGAMCAPILIIVFHLLLPDETHYVIPPPRMAPVSPQMVIVGLVVWAGVVHDLSGRAWRKVVRRRQAHNASSAVVQTRRRVSVKCAGLLLLMTLCGALFLPDAFKRLNLATVFRNEYWEAWRIRACKANILHLSLGLDLYSLDNDGAYPSDLEQISEFSAGGAEKVKLRCPITGKRYIYHPGYNLFDSPPDAVLIEEPADAHLGRPTWRLRVDGSLERNINTSQPAAR